MQGTADAAPSEATGPGHHRGPNYQKVFGPGKRRIRGLWRRGNRFYARLTVEDPVTGGFKVQRIRLEDDPRDPLDCR
jgi:hypothetical protein